MFLLLMLIVIALLVFYIKFKYFTLPGPLPGLAPHFLFGNLIQSGVLLNNVSHPQVYSAFKNRFGDIFQFWIGPRRVIVVSGINDVQHIFTHRNIYDQSDLYVELIGRLFPDALICLKGQFDSFSFIGELVLSSIGAKYRRHASLTLPLFRRNKITSNLDLIIDCTDKLLVKWRTAPLNHVHLDIVQQCRNLVLDIFGLIAFDYDLKTLHNNGNNELTEALKEFLSTVDMLLCGSEIVSAVYLKLSRRHRQAQATTERYVYRMIDHELAENPELIKERKRISLIASLVSALQQEEKVEMIKIEEEKKGLSRSELLHEILFFLMAGYETTSTVLAWIIHFISKYPRVQQKIKAELIDNNAQQDLSLERLDSLVYLDCVINEVLRFSPPVDSTFRTLTVDDRLPESGAQLLAGDQVLIPFQNLSRATRYWSIDPELFYPERFLSEYKNHHSYASIPFGSGYRQCVGQDLARFELKVITARLMQYVTFGDGGPQVNAGGYIQGITVMPKHIGITIEFDE